MNWISIKERLPQNNEICNDMVMYWDNKHKAIKIGCYDYESDDWTDWGHGRSISKFEDVTHWMELPTQPNSDMQYTGASPMQLNSSNEADNQKTLTDNFTDADGRELPKSYSQLQSENEGHKEIARARGEAINELQSQLEESLLLYNNQTKTIVKLQSERDKYKAEIEFLNKNSDELMGSLSKYKALAEAYELALNEITTSEFPKSIAQNALRVPLLQPPTTLTTKK